MPRFLFSLCLVTCCLASVATYAVDLTGRWGLGIEGGFMKLIGGNHDYSNTDQQTTLHLRRGFSPNWSLDLAFKYGYVRPGALPPDDAGFTTSSVAAYYTVIAQPEIGAIYRTSSKGKFSPFLGANIGFTSWSVRDMNEFDSVGLIPDGPTPIVQKTDGEWVFLQQTNFTASVAVGLELFTSESFAINLGARYHFLAGVNRDNIGLSALGSHTYDESADENSGLVEGFLGIQFFFGSTDKDGDGIKDKEDACPNSAEDFDGYEDTDGCPDRDNDGDGVMDVQDDCPDQPEDRDGFQDEDGCPEADNDGDGIPDTADRCPDEPEDVDGFEDEDGCPDPDNDGDGVLDAADLCDGTPRGVQVDENGCPVVEEIKEQLTLLGVNFVSGSAELTPTSMDVLKEVANSLIAYPAVMIEVRGHTDSTGPSELNRNLSQERAMSVRQALIDLGVAPNRITAVGYGEDYPIASNESKEGRAANRRVEIHRTDQ
jgi:outer membrane protein OmpA-like peptidoglycan-associated protein